MKRSLPFTFLALSLVFSSCEEKRDGNYEVNITETRPLTTLDKDPELNKTAGERFFNQKPSPYTAEHPDYWVSVPPRQFESAAYQLNGARITVSEARGGLLVNVNRWFGQFGQNAITADELEALPRINLGGHEAVLVQAQGTFAGRSGRPLPGQALIGAIAPVKDQLLVLKLTGPEVVVGAEMQNFKVFAKTLKNRPSQPESSEQPAS